MRIELTTDEIAQIQNALYAAQFANVQHHATLVMFADRVRSSKEAMPPCPQCNKNDRVVIGADAFQCRVCDTSFIPDTQQQSDIQQEVNEGYGHGV